MPTRRPGRHGYAERATARSGDGPDASLEVAGFATGDNTAQRFHFAEASSWRLPVAAHVG